MSEQLFDGSGFGKRFLFGKEDSLRAAEAAEACGGFLEDYEEECFFDEPVTCYNCRYRRWTADSFTCMRR